jgi:hypothetical protein
MQKVCVGLPLCPLAVSWPFLHVLCALFPACRVPCLLPASQWALGYLHTGSCWHRRMAHVRVLWLPPVGCLVCSGLILNIRVSSPTCTSSSSRVLLDISWLVDGRAGTAAHSSLIPFCPPPSSSYQSPILYLLSGRCYMLPACYGSSSVRRAVLAHSGCTQADTYLRSAKLFADGDGRVV